MQKKAIIFSKNEKLGKFIRGELFLINCDVTIACDLTEVSDNNFDIVIFDTSSIGFDTSYRSYLLDCTSLINIAIIYKEDNERYTSEFDVCLTFPFSLEKLRAILLSDDKKPERKEPNKKTDVSKCFLSDRQRRGVTFNNSYIALSDNEFNLLELLCKNTGTCVSRDTLNKFFGTLDGNIADVYVCHLRKKLEAPFGIKVIYTLREKGYMTDFSIK